MKIIKEDCRVRVKGDDEIGYLVQLSVYTLFGFIRFWDNISCDSINDRKYYSNRYAFRKKEFAIEAALVEFNRHKKYLNSRKCMKTREIVWEKKNG